MQREATYCETGRWLDRMSCQRGQELRRAMPSGDTRPRLEHIFETVRDTRAKFTLPRQQCIELLLPLDPLALSHEGKQVEIWNHRGSIEYDKRIFTITHHAPIVLIRGAEHGVE